MRTLANGIKVPEDKDAGNVWSDGIEFDMEQLDALIARVGALKITDISRSTSNLDPANWLVDADGKGYKQSVSLPDGLGLDKVGLRFRIKSGPRIHTPINPTIIPLSLTSFEVIVNDSTLDLEILYL